MLEAAHARFIATVQVDNALAIHPEAPIGGRLLVTHITKDGMSTESLGQVTQRRPLSTDSATATEPHALLVLDA